MIWKVFNLIIPFHPHDISHGSNSFEALSSLDCSSEWCEYASSSLNYFKELSKMLLMSLSLFLFFYKNVQEDEDIDMWIDWKCQITTLLLFLIPSNN